MAGFDFVKIYTNEDAWSGTNYDVWSNWCNGDTAYICIDAAYGGLFGFEINEIEYYVNEYVLISELKNS